MALKKGTLSKKVYTHNKHGNDFMENPSVQNNSLKMINTNGDCLNDKQLVDVFNKYDLMKLFH